MTRYQEVRQVLAGEIEAGVYQVGGRFPTDHELCERFGVSRHTVREALRALQDQGLLSRRRGAGTTVCARETPTMFMQNMNSMGELMDRAKATRFEARYEGRIVVRPALAAILGCQAGESWLRLAGVRRYMDLPQPHSWNEIFIAAPYAGVRALVGAETPTVYELVMKQYGIELVEIEQEISALTISPDHAAEIETAPNSTGLMVIRRYFTRPRQPFEISLSLYPADRFSFKTNLVNAAASGG